MPLLIRRFADFLREPEEDESGELLPAKKVYEPVPSLQLVKTRAMEYLQRFNEENPAKAAELVLFDDALAHLMIISRIIQARLRHTAIDEVYMVCAYPVCTSYV